VRERFYADIPGDAGFRQLLSEAAEVAAGAGGVLFLPYFTGERSPHWNPDAPALIYNLKLDTSRGQIARAALEGVAFCLADVWKALRIDDTDAGKSYLTGSVARIPAWAQVLSDVLGLRLEAIEAADASVLGAAIVGHMALGSIAGPEAFPRPAASQLIIPDAERHQLYSERHLAFQSLYKHLPGPPPGS